MGASHVLITRVASLLNLGSGITTGTFGTVTFSLSDANGLDGINADARSLVNFNFAEGNGGNGIVVACPSSVTNNEAVANGGLDYVIPPGCLSRNNK